MPSRRQPDADKKAMEQPAAEEVTEEESISSDMGSGMEDSMVEMVPDTSLPENEVLVPAGDE